MKMQFWKFPKTYPKFQEMANLDIHYAVFYPIINFKPYLIQLNAVNNA